MYENSACGRQQNEKDQEEIMVFNLTLRQEIQQEMFLKKKKGQTFPDFFFSLTPFYLSLQLR